MKGVKSLLFICLGALSISSCLKQGASTPPDTSQLDPNLTVNTTLADLSSQALTMASGSYRTLGDTTVSGVVIADDRSGNFYKQIVIQDATGGIVLAVDKASLYLDYPIGRKVYVKLNGLKLINYNGLPEITFNPAAAGNPGIPSSLVSNYIVKASYPNTVTPTDVTVSDLTGVNSSKYYNTLIRLGVADSDPVEFDAVSNAVPYAVPASVSLYTSRYLLDKNQTGALNMSTSAYAGFQPYMTPTGSGNIVVVFSYYKGIQLLLRDTTDVKFTETRF